MHHDNDAGTQILTFTVEKPDGTNDTIQDSVNGGGDLPMLARKMAANYSNQAAAPSGTPSANPPSNQ